jgi:hypothetical protein
MVRGFQVRDPPRRTLGAFRRDDMTRNTARNRDANALKASAIMESLCATAVHNGAIQHSKVEGWCQERDDDVSGKFQCFADHAEQRDTRERRSIALLRSFCSPASPHIDGLRIQDAGPWSAPSLAKPGAHCSCSGQHEVARDRGELVLHIRRL